MRGYRNVDHLVHLAGAEQLGLHALALPAAAGGEKQQYNEECVFHSENPSCTPKGGDVFRRVLYL